MTQSQNSISHQPTLMQNLLGRSYKWWYIFAYNFKLANNDLTGLVVAVIRFTIPLLISLLIYSSFENTKNLTGELAATYYIFQFGIMAFGLSWDLRFNIMKGGLSNKLLLPTDYINTQFFVALGYSGFVFIIRTILLIPIMILTKSPFIISANIFLTVLLMVIAFISFVYLEIIIGSIAFWIPFASNRIIEIYGDLAPLLAGALVILDLNSITNIFKLNPFSLSAYHPMQIYLGKYSPLETFYVFAGGIAWCVVLYFLAKWVFKMGLKQNEAVGL